MFYDPFLLNGVDKALGVRRVKTVDALFREADVISLHCANTPDTQHIVNDHTLSLVKPGAILVNAARGEAVDLAALERALRSGKLAGAGLDVLEVEPVPEPAPPLIQAYRNREPWLMGRFIVTPHCAFFSGESVKDIQVKSTETMRDILFDGLSTNVIDPSSW